MSRETHPCAHSGNHPSSTWRTDNCTCSQGCAPDQPQCQGLKRKLSQNSRSCRYGCEEPRSRSHFFVAGLTTLPPASSAGFPFPLRYNSPVPSTLFPIHHSPFPINQPYVLSINRMHPQLFRSPPAGSRAGHRGRHHRRARNLPAQPQFG
jgi:hypothetical protein